MNRAELTDTIIEQKRAKSLSWKTICQKINPEASPLLITAALLGQMTLKPDEAKKALEVLGLKPDAEKLLCEVPYRGALPPGPPTDPLIYRFWEVTQIYGPTWKALIEEEFGDGIMSAIDFDMKLKRVADPKGDRVEVTFSGKFLPYKRY